MNGCLFKLLIAFCVLLAMVFSAPHLIKYADQATQGKFENFEFKTKVLKKMGKHIINNQLEEIKNDQSKHLK